MPGVLLRALSEYKFVGTPLWRMSDGKDLVRAELTFPKKLPTPRFYKKGTESRRQPAPPAGEWPCQSAPATRPPPRRVPTQTEREMLPPPTQTILQTPQQIIRPRYKNRATITASPTFTRPPPASPESPPSKRARKESPAPATDRPIQYCYFHYEEEYMIHEKYDLQDALNSKLHGNDVAIIKAQRIPQEDEMNIDLPVYFLHRPCITKTCLYNFDSRKPHFCIIKLGFTGVYIFFSYFAKNHKLWVLVRTTSPRRL